MPCPDTLLGMVSRFEPAPGLNAAMAIALRPTVDRLNEAVRDAARRGAPNVRIWLTVRDERVRRSHEKADGQVIPDNLRFKLWKPGNGHDLAKHPRDPNLPLNQKANCRCDDPVLEGVLAATINALPAVLQGTRVVAQTETRFPRAGESEEGNTQDQGAFFMRNALREVAARLNARSHR